MSKKTTVRLAKPADHKTAVHGHDRTIYIGKRAQDVIRPFLIGRAIDKPLFSPAESEQDRRDELTRGRVTPMSCGNTVGSNRKKNGDYEEGDHYLYKSESGVMFYYHYIFDINLSQ